MRTRQYLHQCAVSLTGDVDPATCTNCACSDPLKHHHSNCAVMSLETTSAPRSCSNHSRWTTLNFAYTTLTAITSDHLDLPGSSEPCYLSAGRQRFARVRPGCLRLFAGYSKRRGQHQVCYVLVVLGVSGYFTGTTSSSRTSLVGSGLGPG